MNRNPHSNDIIEEIHEYCIDIGKNIIYLHGHMTNVEEDLGTEFRMANRFLKNLLCLDKEDDKITVHQQNIGGEWQSGIMIYDTIKNAQSHVAIVCHGEVMSMGTIIMQAADSIISMPNCHFVFHYGFTGIGEREYTAGHSWAEMEKRQTKKMMEIYSSACTKGEFFKGKTESQVRKFLDTKFKSKGDWHLDPEEAKYYGFIDKIIGIDCELKDL